MNSEKQMKTMNFYFVLTCACALSHCVSAISDFQTDWEEWKRKHEKVYASDEDQRIHLEIWKKNYAYMYVKEHYSKVNTGFSVEMNYLADQNFSRVPIRFQQHGNKVVDAKAVRVPKNWDWLTKGAITSVKNQGQYDIPQGFAASDCVTSFWYIKTGHLVGVSAMEVHDCCVNSSLIEPGIFQCIHSIGGLCAAYPDVPDTCRNNTCSAVIQINGGVMIQPGNETAMMEAVYKMPVFAPIDASHASFQLYRSGVHDESRCSRIKSDHVVQVVGYGKEDGRDYWLGKNSWGTSWGENGYIKIARNKNNMCGIATQSTYPV